MELIQTYHERLSVIFEVLFMLDGYNLDPRRVKER